MLEIIVIVLGLAIFAGGGAAVVTALVLLARRLGTTITASKDAIDEIEQHK